MVDDTLLTAGVAAILAGIALVLLGGAAYIAYQALERRLDARAGIPAPDEEEQAHRAAPPPARPESAPSRQHQPA
ncbi:hypothetical protein [Streptomonospora litoralis]|uniref:Uncharacterized protein n=1 Tax=Streptomonospora litoralis TaxID=2498135 RepID=A0A4P6Q620_9ACTN|nr:hypothetical protein [Streptomonospora litoralis]QBI54469.1 hypothetical protein EKD16_13435 [Streptomonospora litoralis]